MSVERIKRLTEELQAHLKQARGIADGAGDRDFTEEERAAITDLMGKAGDVKNQLNQLKADNRTRDAIRELGEGIGVDEGKQERVTPSGLVVPEKGKSLGEAFVASPEYKALLESAPGGHFTKEHRVQARPVGYGRLLPNRRGEKTLVTGTSDTSAGTWVRDDWIGFVSGMELFQRPLTLRSLVTSGTTTSDTVEYARVTGITNNAASVAEATATAGSSGTKPESAIATAKVTTPVRTIAHWIPITKRAMSDAAQVLTLIDNFLLYGLEEEVEDQMIAGDGTGENLDGLSHVSGVQTQAAAGDLLTTLRQAKTKVRVVGRAVPNGYVMNPADVEDLDLLTDNENRFYFGGPGGSYVGATGAAGPLWNLPIVESEAIPAGTAYIGDWRKAILWDREQASITMTDSHSDFFIRNMVAILAELRVAFGVVQPSAFVKITLP